MTKNKDKYYDAETWMKDSQIDTIDKYKQLYKQSISEPELFWDKIAERISWYRKWDNTRKYDFINGDINWFMNGKLNVSYNCLDRHVSSGNGSKTAIIWEGNNLGEDKTFTYEELLGRVKRFCECFKKAWYKKR